MDSTLNKAHMGAWVGPTVGLACIVGVYCGDQQELPFAALITTCEIAVKRRKEVHLTYVRDERSLLNFLYSVDHGS